MRRLREGLDRLSPGERNWKNARRQYTPGWITKLDEYPTTQERINKSIRRALKKFPDVDYTESTMPLNIQIDELNKIGTPGQEWEIGQEAVLKRGPLHYYVTIIDTYGDGSYEVEIWLTGDTMTVTGEHLGVPK